MQKILRTLIIIAMLITGYLLILAWRDDYTNVNKPVAITPTTTAVSSNDVPVAGVSGTPPGDIPTATATTPTAAPTTQKTSAQLKL